LNHVKYVLPNGDRGIVRGLESPVYVTKVHGNNLYCLDREGKMRTVEIDTTEAMFKLALERKDYPGT
jgi:coatomer protein complex subunit alpha (xenin)